MLNFFYNTAKINVQILSRKMIFEAKLGTSYKLYIGSERPLHIEILYLNYMKTLIPGTYFYSPNVSNTWALFMWCNHRLAHNDKKNTTEKNKWKLSHWSILSYLIPLINKYSENSSAIIWVSPQKQVSHQELCSVCPTLITVGTWDIFVTKCQSGQTDFTFWKYGLDIEIFNVRCFTESLNQIKYQLETFWISLMSLWWCVFAGATMTLTLR
jgi:hypothetical protein